MCKVLAISSPKALVSVLQLLKTHISQTSEASSTILWVQHQQMSLFSYFLSFSSPECLSPSARWVAATHPTVICHRHPWPLTSWVRMTWTVPSVPNMPRLQKDAPTVALTSKVQRFSFSPWFLSNYLLKCFGQESGQTQSTWCYVEIFLTMILDKLLKSSSVNIRCWCQSGHLDSENKGYFQELSALLTNLRG